MTSSHLHSTTAIARPPECPSAGDRERVPTTTSHGGGAAPPFANTRAKRAVWAMRNGWQLGLAREDAGIPHLIGCPEALPRLHPGYDKPWAYAVRSLQPIQVSGPGNPGGLLEAVCDERHYFDNNGASYSLLLGQIETCFRYIEAIKAYATLFHAPLEYGWAGGHLPAARWWSRANDHSWCISHGALIAAGLAMNVLEERDFGGLGQAFYRLPNHWDFIEFEKRRLGIDSSLGVSQ